MSELQRFNELKEALADLPQLRVIFGGAHECVPPAILREKVLAVVDQFIREAREREAGYPEV